MSSSLVALRDIIVSSINTIIAVCNETGCEFPSLDEPFHSSEFTADGIRNDPRMLHPIVHGIAAASQLIATLQAPATSLTVAMLMVCHITMHTSLYLITGVL